MPCCSGPTTCRHRRTSRASRADSTHFTAPEATTTVGAVGTLRPGSLLTAKAAMWPLGWVIRPTDTTWWPGATSKPPTAVGAPPPLGGTVHSTYCESLLLLAGMAVLMSHALSPS